MTDRVKAGGLQVAKELYDFVNTEALPGTGVDQGKFWDGLGALIHTMAGHISRSKWVCKKYRMA